MPRSSIKKAFRSISGAASKSLRMKMWPRSCWRFTFLANMGSDSKMSASSGDTEGWAPQSRARTHLALVSSERAPARA